MTKNVFSSILLLALSIVISFVTIHMKTAFCVAAANDSDLVPLLDTSRNMILVDTKYYIFAVSSEEEGIYHGLTLVNKSVSITNDLGIPVTYSHNSREGFTSESQSMFIQFDPNYKWRINNNRWGSFVSVSNHPNISADLFTITKVADQPKVAPYYHICFTNYPLRIDGHGRVVAGTVNGDLLQVVFDKVTD